MSAFTLTRRDRRALSLGGLIALPVVVWSLALAPYVRAVGDARERLDGDRALLARELEVLASADRYPGLLAQGTRALAQARPHLLDGATGPAAGAALVAYVQGRARASAVALNEIAPQPDSVATQGILPVSLRLDGTGDLEGLLTFLRALESGPKLVSVSEVEIEATEAIAASDAAGEEGTGLLAFHLSVTGFASPTPEAAPLARLAAEARP
jgi:hypothetical protein